MIREVQPNCARSYEWTMPALETGVESNADLVMLQAPPEKRGGIGISHSAYEIRKRKRVWAVVLKGSGLATDEGTDLSRSRNDYVIVTDVKIRGEKMTRVINIYHQRDVRTRERQARKVNWGRTILQRAGGRILEGDFNVHSHRSDPRYKEQ